MERAGLVTICMLLMLGNGCGRNGLAMRTHTDAAAADLFTRDAGQDTPDSAGDPRDLAPDFSRDTGIDAAIGPDLGVRDATPADVADGTVAADATATIDLAAGCPPLPRYGVLNLGHIKKALFSRDGHSLLVRIGAADKNDADDAMWIAVPGGESKVLGKNVRDVEWLGQDAALLTTADRLLAVSLDGRLSRGIAAPVCGHTATPDGSRIYYVSGACDYISGPLNVLDVASGAITQMAAKVSTAKIAVSPDGGRVAYVSYPDGATTGTGTIYVADATGTSYAITQAAFGWQPVFVSNDVLIFQSQGDAGSEPGLWRHDLGTRTNRWLADGDVGIPGYEIASDGSAVLLSKFDSSAKTGELYQVPFAGGEPIRLATDLLDYRMYEMVIRTFAFALPSRRVIYLAGGSGTTGRSPISVALDGGRRVALPSGDPVIVSPFADRVALASVTAVGGLGTVAVTSGQGTSQFTIRATSAVRYASFVPRDRGLLFVETQADATNLRHLSFASGVVSTLARWGQTTLPLYTYPVGISSQEYPVDPTGCFAVVDSDYDDTASRLVAIPD
jgi:hypothetical protein